MSVRVAIAVAAVSFGIVACRSALQTRTLSPIPPRRSEVVRLPASNVDAEAGVGSPLLATTSERTQCPAIELTSAVVHQATRYSSPFVLKVPRGTLYAAARDPSGTFYASKEPLEFSPGPDGQSFEVRGGVFVPDAAPQDTELFWLDAGGTPLNDGHPGIPYERTTVETCGRSRRELVLGGVSPGRITVVYRELVGDPPKVAHSEELGFDLSKGDVVACHGARIQIVSATSAGVKYRVLAPLD